MVELLVLFDEASTEIEFDVMVFDVCSSSMRRCLWAVMAHNLKDDKTYGSR
jgi:hypothetical protein